MTFLIIGTVSTLVAVLTFTLCVWFHKTYVNFVNKKSADVTGKDWAKAAAYWLNATLLGVAFGLSAVVWVMLALSGWGTPIAIAIAVAHIAAAVIACVLWARAAGSVEDGTVDGVAAATVAAKTATTAAKAATDDAKASADAAKAAAAAAMAATQMVTAPKVDSTVNVGKEMPFPSPAPSMG